MSLKPHLRLLAALLFLSIPAFVACSPADEQVENPTPEASGNVGAVASGTAVATTVPTIQPTTTPAPTATATPTPLQQAYADARQIVVDKALEPTESLVELAAALFVIPNPNDSGIPFASPDNATLHEENNLTYALLADGRVVQLRQTGESANAPEDLVDALFFMSPEVDENGNPIEEITRGSLTLGGQQIEAWIAYEIESGDAARFVDPATNQWTTPLLADQNGNIQAIETRAIDENGNATGEAAYFTFGSNGEQVPLSGPNGQSLASLFGSGYTLVSLEANGVQTLGITPPNIDRTEYVLEIQNGVPTWTIESLSTIDPLEAIANSGYITPETNVEMLPNGTTPGFEIVYHPDYYTEIGEPYMAYHPDRVTQAIELIFNLNSTNNNLPAGEMIIPVPDNTTGEITPTVMSTGQKLVVHYYGPGMTPPVDLPFTIGEINSRQFGFVHDGSNNRLHLLLQTSTTEVGAIYAELEGVLVALSQDLQQTGLDQPGGLLVREFPNNYQVRDQLNQILAFVMTGDGNRIPAFRIIHTELQIDPHASEVIADQLRRGYYPDIDEILEKLNLPEN